MVRTLTSPASTRAAATGATPITIIKIEFPSPTGTKYYSDRALGSGDGSSALNAMCRVVSWGGIVAAYAERTVNPVGDCRVTMLDGDLALKAIFDAKEWQRCKATIYQYWSGLVVGDLVPIMAGIVNAPVTWKEERATVDFDITDISTLFKKDIGTLLTRTDFPQIARSDEGRMVPIVVGKVRRSPMIALNDGAVTELVKNCGFWDDLLFVADAERFPQNTPVKIRIDREIITGHFEGNTFHVSARGSNVVDSHVTAPRDSSSFYDSTLSDTDGFYVGFDLKMYYPNGESVNFRQVTLYSGEEHCVVFMPPVWYPAGEAWTIPAGWAYQIGTWPAVHWSGAKVVLYEINGVPYTYKYVVNDGASVAVRQVEGYGQWTNFVITHDPDTGEVIGWTGPFISTGWQNVSPVYYTVNRCDTSVFGVDHPVTTITFAKPPLELFANVNEMTATMDGLDDNLNGEGSLVEVPSDVIQTLLLAYMGDAILNTASFTQAYNNGAQYLKFAFTLTEPRDSLELLSDLAFQARCAILWEDGKATLRFLSNKLPSSSLTLTTGNIVEDSLEISRSSFEDVITEVKANFTPLATSDPAKQHPERETIVAKDAVAETAYGRHVREIDLWAYGKKKYANAIAQFWLYRWKHLWTQVRVKEYLPALKLQRLDSATLNWPTFFRSGQKGKVMKIEHQPGSAESRQMDAISLDLSLPIWAGCSTTCEVPCETAGEIGCYLSCETGGESCWQCEVSCETPCEITGCTTSAQDGCLTTDTGCSDACETACQSGCETVCESGCQVECETGCQTSCESECELECETGAELCGACGEDEVPCEYRLVIAGLVGAMDWANGTWLLPHSTTCYWQHNVDADTFIRLRVYTTWPYRVEVYIQNATGDYCTWIKAINPDHICLKGGTLGPADISSDHGANHGTDPYHTTIKFSPHEECCGTSCETSCEDACETACEVTCETGCQVNCEAACESSYESGWTACAICEPDETPCEYLAHITGVTGTHAWLNGWHVMNHQDQCAYRCVFDYSDGNPFIRMQWNYYATGYLLFYYQEGVAYRHYKSAFIPDHRCSTPFSFTIANYMDGDPFGGDFAAAVFELTPSVECSCESSCETGCETVCETGCQIECETGCESSCESGCETSCETGCETSCETGCESSCESGCETTCESHCETDCESGCETSCETGGETACTSHCETSCETGCEVHCEVSDCENVSEWSFEIFESSGCWAGQTGSMNHHGPGLCGWHSADNKAALSISEEGVVTFTYTCDGSTITWTGTRCDIGLLCDQAVPMYLWRTGGSCVVVTPYVG